MDLNIRYRLCLETTGAWSAILALLHILQNADLELKIAASRLVSDVITRLVFGTVMAVVLQIMQRVLESPTAAALMTSHPGWQQVLVRLLVRSALPGRKRTSSETGSEHSALFGVII